jgi:hypothetical protein
VRRGGVAGSQRRPRSASRVAVRAVARGQRGERRGVVGVERGQRRPRADRLLAGGERRELAIDRRELGLARGPERLARRVIEHGRREPVDVPRVAEHSRERAQVADPPRAALLDEEHAEHLPAAGPLEHAAMRVELRREPRDGAVQRWNHRDARGVRKPRRQLALGGRRIEPEDGHARAP